MHEAYFDFVLHNSQNDFLKFLKVKFTSCRAPMVPKTFSALEEPAMNKFNHNPLSGSLDFS